MSDNKKIKEESDFTWQQNILGAKKFLSECLTLGMKFPPSQKTIDDAKKYLEDIEDLNPVNVQISINDEEKSNDIDIDAAWSDERGGFRIAKVTIFQDETPCVIFVNKIDGFLYGCSGNIAEEVISFICRKQ